MPPNFSNQELDIIECFESINIPVDKETLKEYTSAEKKKIQTLARSMVYYYNKVKSADPISRETDGIKYVLQFRALEWVFNQLGIIVEGTARVEFE